MAIAYTNHGGTASSSIAATSANVTVTAVIGDTIIVAVGLVGLAPTSVTDNASPANSYTQIAGPSTNTEEVTMWASRNIAHAPTTVTVNFSSSKFGIAVDTWSGVQGFGVVNNSNTGTTSPATISLASLGTNNWSVAAFTEKGTSAWGASTGNLRKNIAGPSTTSPGAALVDNTTVTDAATTSTALWAGCSIELLSPYQSTLTAGMSAFAGAIVKTDLKVLAASMSTFAATVVKQVSRQLTSGMSAFSGSLVKQAIKSLAGSMSTFAGSIVENATHVLALVASMSTFAGTVVKLTLRALVSSMSTFAGAIVKTTNRILAAGMATFSGIVGQIINVPLLASMSQFAGSLVETVNKALVATGVPINWLNTLHRRITKR